MGLRGHGSLPSGDCPPTRHYSSDSDDSITSAKMASNPGVPTAAAAAAAEHRPTHDHHSEHTNKQTHNRHRLNTTCAAAAAQSSYSSHKSSSSSSQSCVKSLTTIFIVLLHLLFINHALVSLPTLQAQQTSVTSENLLHCPEDWRREGIYCYRFFNIRHSWKRAAEICRRYGSELVLISDYTLNNFTASLAEQSARESGDDVRSFWIGFQSIDQLSTNTIESASGRFVSKYVGFWDYDEPNVDNGQCIRSSIRGSNGVPGVWSLNECENLLPFICQKQTCPTGSFHCANGRCINRQHLCDGEDDCEDRSDESDCPRKCSFYLQSSGDKVVSPNYPNKYEPNSDCKWTLEGPVGSGMIIQFSEFDTETNYDQVQILVGGRTEETSVSLATLSGHQNITHRSFTTGSNLMIVKFRSDSAVEKRGFRASWKTEPIKCGGEFQAHETNVQKLSSPHYPSHYPGGMECVYVIRAPHGKVITLEVTELDLEDEKDFLVIRDGQESKNSPLAKFSGNMTEKLSKSHERYIVSTGDSLYVYFHSSVGVHGRRGFNIRYKAGCEMELIADQGVVTSPAFGVTSYPTNQNCVYKISREKASVPLSIVFNDFDVTPEDVLQIYDGHDVTNAVSLHPSRGFGVKTKPVGLTLTASSGKMLLMFKTNALKAGKGWTAKYSSDCSPLKVGRSAIASARGSMFGSKLTFTCPVGQEFATGETKLKAECEMGGKWSLPAIPNCQERYCGPVPQIDNGFAVGSTNVTFRGIATYQCYAGFAFPSNKQTESIRCGEDGKWDKLPLCLASSCPPLPETPHAIQSIMAGNVNRSYGTIVRFECEPGYHRRGVPVIVCTSIGQWSGLPPLCERAKCPILPEIKNGYLALADQSREFKFADELRIFCNRGFKLEGSAVVKCSANQTFGNVPRCVDIDECSPANTACDMASTKCTNTKGGFYCACRPGFEPNLNCRPVSDLGLSSGTIPDVSIKVSGTEEGFKKGDIRLDTSTQRPTGGWCGAVPKVGENWAQVDLKAPVVIRGFRIQSVARVDGSQAYPVTVRLQYSDDLTDIFRDYSDISGRPVQFRLAPNGGSGLSIVNLPIPLEARFVRILIMEYTQAPCMRFELMGCTRQDCIDINECLDRNGGCDHRCVNSPGGSSCQCNVGNELYTKNGTAGFWIPPTETGTRDGDIYRLNKTCVPKQCPSLSSPENGQLLSTATKFHFGDVVSFSCDFGYVMTGPRTLSCGQNGNWNGTIPQCHYAQCVALSDDSSQGLKLEYEDNERTEAAGNVALVSYLGYANATCTEPGRPNAGTRFSGFRQCVYDPKDGQPDFTFSGTPLTCPRIDCGKPADTTGSNYGFHPTSLYRSHFFFGCGETFSLAGKTARGDATVRCTEKGYWDFGDIRCEGPVCQDPGRPADGRQVATSYEHNSQVSFECDRPGYEPYSSEPITCMKNADCSVIKPLGISSGVVPDHAINATNFRVNYEPRKIRLGSATGWCADPRKKDSFPYVQVDLGKPHKVKAFLVKGVVTDDIVGRPNELRLFYKNKDTESFTVYFPNFNLTFKEPGNYGELVQINLPSMIVARYVTLGIVSYTGNACFKFDLLGCEDHKDDVVLGFDKAHPICVDREPPKFLNCPTQPLMVTKTSQFGILPLNFTLPVATDNSGYIARLEVSPVGFRPPVMIFNDTQVVYTAYDASGNVGRCQVNITVPDTTPPTLYCPQSYVVELVEEQDVYTINFNETKRAINATDNSGPVTIQIMPEIARIPMRGYRNVTVTASDRFGNEAQCHFQVSVEPMRCVPWSLQKPSNGDVVCKQNEQANGYRCLAKCNPGFRFIDSDAYKLFECTVGQHWRPAREVLECIPQPVAVTDDANYDVVATVEYRSGGFAPPSCMERYVKYIEKFYTELDKTLSKKCSDVAVPTDIKFVNTSIALKPNANELSIKFVARIDTNDRRKIYYNLCGDALGIAFDLTTATSKIIEPLLNISTKEVGGSCPSLMALRSDVINGFTCGPGEIIHNMNQTEDVTGYKIPRCLECPTGTFSSIDLKSCMKCPLGWYQDMTGQAQCKQCPEGTYTRKESANSVSDCVPVCGLGTYSPTGLVPCLQCPENTFAGVPPKEGFKECQKCHMNTFTHGPGSVSNSQCRTRCPRGTYSETGLEPCSPCPVNLYQELEGQTTCHECSGLNRTLRPGAADRKACIQAECSTKCMNGGVCLVSRHEPHCHCPAGFTGARCETDVDECSSEPCFNGGECRDAPQGFRCVCPPGFSGLQCEIERDECGAETCPEKSMCQNLPGINNVNCLCRAGYEGPSCNVTINPCSSAISPCDNGAQCQALAQGRYYCQCPPGWTGQKCETNIDDCAEQPCLLGAQCTDMVNDFQCDCPPGFTGKRCEQKIDLCANDKCANGVCVDRLFYHECICEPGWTGPRCDININECESSPCENDAECIDLVDGFKCECDSSSYAGSRCQHEIDACEVNPCQNGGTCLDQQIGFECQCKPGFVGLQCEAEVDECVSSPCSPLGTEACLDLDNSFKCKCNLGFSGEFCEVNNDDCKSNPCMNEGKCVDQINGFKCVCEPGWTGDRCERDVGHCDSSPCHNNARCVDLFQDYFCVCPSGTDGKRCQTAPQRCIGDPCQNSGVCQDFGSGLNCSCPAKFTGIGCQYEFRACDTVDRCKNDGKCIDKPNGGFECVCKDGFTGRNCEEDVVDCQPTSCPPSASCIDLTSSFLCKCPFNATGEDCRKPINVDYELYFNDRTKSASASLSTPFELKETQAVTVGFWVQFQPETTGVYFTMYEVDHPHIVSKNRRALLQANHLGVLIQFFPSNNTSTSKASNDIFLPYLESVPINDGQWHYINIIWSSTEGQLMLITDSAVAASVTEYGVGESMPKLAWIMLGGPTGEGFHGRVSRVNVWTRTLDLTQEIPSQLRSCRHSPVIFPGLVLRWNGYDQVEGTVERVGPGTCGQHICPNGYSGEDCSILQQDKTPPQVLHCPPDMWVISANASTIVHWDEPQFSDDLHRVQVLEADKIRSGESIKKGDYDLSYIALDGSGNTARCDFQVHVLREFCTIPEPPINGQRDCSDWGPGGRFKVCQIKCNSGLSFSEPIPQFYVCGAEGFWRPTRLGQAPDTPLTFPACSPKHNAQRIFRLTMTFPTSVVCSESGKKILAARAQDSILRVDRLWKICSDYNRGSCKGLNVNVKCSKLTSRLSKRDTENNREVQQDVYTLELSFPANSDPISAASNAVPTPASVVTNDKDSLEAIVRRAVMESAIFDVRDTLPNVLPDLNSLDLITEYACPPGQVVNGNQCVECGAGTHFDDSTGQCQKCPIGTYQDELAQLACKQCPNSNGVQEVTIARGSRNIADCRERCPAGKYFDLQAGTCRSCGHGLYQANEGAFSCTPCAPGLTTRSSEAISESECRPECEAGHQLTSTGACEACPVGQYRTRGQPSCERCPSGFTTGARASINIQSCNLEICTVGHYLNQTIDECQPCPKGTFQDQEQRDISCQSCPVNSTTSGIGAISSEHCANPCLINDKVELCPTHSECQAPSVGSEDFRCVCREGYKEVPHPDGLISSPTSPYCVDVCDDFCMNGGKCNWQPGMKRPHCECLINFYGDRCERKSELIYIAGGIGAAVFFIIFIVLLIWMICVRTASRPVASKKMSLHTIPTDFGPGGAGSQQNFYYGAPAPYAESVAPSHHSTYAHYYDDEDDGWEMPNFYNETYMKESLHNAKSNNGTLQGITNPSIYSTNKEDLYDRLRKHQYVVKKTDSNSESEDQIN